MAPTFAQVPEIIHTRARGKKKQPHKANEHSKEAQMPKLETHSEKS